MTPRSLRRHPAESGLAVGSLPSCASCLRNVRIGEIRTAFPSRTRACGTSPKLPDCPTVSISPAGSHQRNVDQSTSHSSEPQVNTYPASEQRISEIERGRICNAILPMPFAQTLSAGDSIVFALASSRPGMKSGYVKFGDSVCVLLTEIADLGATDLATRQALFDSPGNRSVKAVHPTLTPSLSWSRLALIQRPSRSLCPGFGRVAREVPCLRCLLADDGHE